MLYITEILQQPKIVFFYNFDELSVWMDGREAINHWKTVKIHLLLHLVFVSSV